MTPRLNHWIKCLDWNPQKQKDTNTGDHVRWNAMGFDDLPKIRQPLKISSSFHRMMSKLTVTTIWLLREIALKVLYIVCVDTDQRYNCGAVGEQLLDKCASAQSWITRLH